MIQIQDRRCKFCNWLNKEVSNSFTCKNCNKESSKKEELEIVEQVEETKTSNDWLKEVDKIKGIGEETLSDIERIYPSKESLLGALKDDTCPFRNDVVQRLKSKLIK